MWGGLCLGSCSWFGNCWPDSGAGRALMGGLRRPPSSGGSCFRRTCGGVAVRWILDVEQLGAALGGQQ